MDSNLSNQYAPPKSAVADVADAEVASLAGRGTRLVALFLDSLIGFIGFMPSWITSAGAFAHADRGNPLRFWIDLAKSGGWFYLGAAIALVVLVVDLILLSRNGQTIGKKLMGIKVVRTDGSAVSLFRVFFLRYVCNSFLTVIPSIGALYSLVDCLMIFGEKRRTVHDYIADTIVINA